MRKFHSTLLAALLLPSVLRAQNPISPMGGYIADPTARVDRNGRLYIYGSLDESPEYYCSKDYHVLSSADLKRWTLHPYAFRNDETLYAPDLKVDWFRFAGKPGDALFVDAREAGAIGDGVTKDTEAMQAAIDRISAQGGGTLSLSDGTFLTGNLFLRDNVELRVEAGTTLLGSTDPEDYVPLEDIGMPEGRGKDSSRMGLLIAHRVKNVKLSGGGTIDGQGRALALHIDSLNIRSIAPNPKEKRRRPSEQQRQKLIFCSESEGITIEDLHLKNSSVWGVSFDSCSHIRVEGVHIHNRAYWNNDGIDLADCAHAVIRGCDIDAADDGICFKSYRDDFVNEDILVEDCRIVSSASAVKIGTASYGAWKGVTIRRIDVRDTFRSAIAIESVDGARIEGVLVEDIDARNTGNPIFIRLGKRHGDGKGILKGITIRNFRCVVPFGIPDLAYDVRGPIDESVHNPIPCSVTGIPGHPVEDVLIENVTLAFPGRASKPMGYVPLSRLDLVPEKETNYPEFDMFGELPAWAFYLRHVRGIRFKDVRLTLKEADYRRAFVLDDVEGALFEHVIPMSVHQQ